VAALDLKDDVDVPQLAEVMGGIDLAHCRI